MSLRIAEGIVEQHEKWLESGGDRAARGVRHQNLIQLVAAALASEYVRGSREVQQIAELNVSRAQQFNLCNRLLDAKNTPRTEAPTPDVSAPVEGLLETPSTTTE